MHAAESSHDPDVAARREPHEVPLQLPDRVGALAADQAGDLLQLGEEAAWDVRDGHARDRNAIQAL